MTDAAQQDYMERMTLACNASVQFSEDYHGQLYRFKGAEFQEMFAQEILFYKPIELLEGQVWGEGILVTYDTDDLKKMFETGIIPRDQSVELIDGHLFKNLEKTEPQIHAELDLNMALLRELGDEVIIHGGFYLDLGAKFAVAPPTAVLQLPGERYEYRNPSIGDVYLIAEVLEENPKFWQLKLAAYARACVPELWVLNLKTQQLEVYADSNGEEFQHKVTLEHGQKVAPLEFPDTQIRWW
jgi:Uma2 family endonuclease